MDDLDNLLPRCETFHDVCAHGAVFDVSYKAFDDFIVDIGFQQSHTHFAEHVFNILFADLTLAFELGEGILQSFA